MVAREIEKAGFKLDAAAEFLRNPADPRDWNASPSAAGEQARHQRPLRAEVPQALSAFG